MTIYLKTEWGEEALPPSDFPNKMGVEYLHSLEFSPSSLFPKIINLLTRQKITQRQSWLGNYYGQSIESAQAVNVSLSWIYEIGGYGVFANQFIPKKSYIGQYLGVVRRRSFFSRLDNLYCLSYPISNGFIHYVIDAEKKGNFTRYINHSQNPNVEIASLFYRGMLYMILYAVADIPEGQQLLCDYGEEYWKKREKPLIL